MPDFSQCAVVLVLEEDVLGGEEDDLVLLLAHGEEQLHIDLVQPALVNLPAPFLEGLVVLHLHLRKLQLLQPIVLLQLVDLDLIVSAALDLLLTDTDLGLELREIPVLSEPVIKLSDGVEGG